MIDELVSAARLHRTRVMRTEGRPAIERRPVLAREETCASWRCILDLRGGGPCAASCSRSPLNETVRRPALSSCSCARSMSRLSRCASNAPSSTNSTRAVLAIDRPAAVPGPQSRSTGTRIATAWARGSHAAFSATRSSAVRKQGCTPGSRSPHSGSVRSVAVGRGGRQQRQARGARGRASRASVCLTTLLLERVKRDDVGRRARAHQSASFVKPRRSSPSSSLMYSAHFAWKAAGRRVRTARACTSTMSSASCVAA